MTRFYSGFILVASSWILLGAILFQSVLSELAGDSQSDEQEDSELATAPPVPAHKNKAHLAPMIKIAPTPKNETHHHQPPKEHIHKHHHHHTLTHSPHQPPTVKAPTLKRPTPVHPPTPTNKHQTPPEAPATPKKPTPAHPPKVPTSPKHPSPAHPPN